MSHLLTYLDRRKSFRGGIDRVGLFLTTKKPYKAAANNTMCNWVKHILKCSRVDTTTFSAVSTRAASTSKATEQGAPIDVEMATAGWTQNSTFAKYYKKPIMKEEQLSAYVLPN